MGSRGRPRTDIHERVLALYRHGQRPAAIAKRLRVTKQRVSRVLTLAGIDAGADARALAGEANAAFVATWEASPDLATAAKRLGLTREQTRIKAGRLRSLGVALKYFPRVVVPTYTRAIVALHEQGLTALEIAARGYNQGTVYVVLRQFKPAGSNAGKVWTAAEDALVGTLTDAEMATRTGRKVSAVGRRRNKLRERRPERERRGRPG